MAIEMWLIWMAAAFLAGSIPFAVLIGKAKGVDIRQHGSGNPGATNLGRAVGKKWGVICFVLDVGKGLLPVMAFGFWLAVRDFSHSFNPGLNSDPTEGTRWAFQWVFIAVAAVCGHIFSPWLGFRGGKGVATGLGATLGLFPIVTIPGVIAFVIWYAVCKATGYVGLASVIAAASLPVLTGVNGLVLGLTGGEIAVFTGLTALLAALVILRHRGNLARLRAGTERKAAWTGRANQS